MFAAAIPALEGLGEAAWQTAPMWAPAALGYLMNKGSSAPAGEMRLGDYPAEYPGAGYQNSGPTYRPGANWSAADLATAQKMRGGASAKFSPIEQFEEQPAGGPLLPGQTIPGPREGFLARNNPFAAGLSPVQRVGRGIIPAFLLWSLYEAMHGGEKSGSGEGQSGAPAQPSPGQTGPYIPGWLDEGGNQASRMEVPGGGGGVQQPGGSPIDPSMLGQVWQAMHMANQMGPGTDAYKQIIGNIHHAMVAHGIHPLAASQLMTLASSGKFGGGTDWHPGMKNFTSFENGGYGGLDPRQYPLPGGM